MVRKTEALVRDLAKLFVRYDLADWKPILDELGPGGRAQSRIAAAIEGLSLIAEGGREKVPSRSNPKRKRVAVDRSLLVKATPERRGALEDLAEGLLARKVLPRAPDVRAAYIAGGGKGPLPKDRPAAVGALLALLIEMSDGRFSEALEAIWRSSHLPETNLKHDYARWFSIIYRATGDPSG